MSHQATNWVTEHVVVGSPFGKSILTHLANCADPFGIAYPSVDYLVRVTELSRASVFRWIRVLEKGGALARIDTQNQGGQAVRGYQLALGKSFDLSTGESHSETAESQSETQKPAGATDPVSDCDSPSLSSETPYNPSPNPSTNPKPLSSGEAPKGIQEGSKPSPKATAEPLIGIRTFVAAVPGWELGDIARLEVEARKLSPSDWRKAQDRAPLYAVKLVQFKQRPKAAHLWLRKRMFEQFGSGAPGTAIGPSVFVAHGTPQWQAWCNFYAVAHGGTARIPSFRQAAGPHAERGYSVVSEWPPGGDLWLVPYADWLVVEQYTPQYNRYAERVYEVLKRAPTLYRPSSLGHGRRLIARNDGRWGDRTYVGLLVPLEWPPRKTEAPTVPDDQNDNPESLMSEEDMNERF